MPMAAIGAASCARWSRSTPTPASPAWARWAAAARVPSSPSRGWPPTSSATTRSSSRRCASRSRTRPPASTTTAPSCWPRSSSPASTSWARRWACRSTRCSAASCATRCRSPPTCSSAIRRTRRATARSARPSSSWPMRARSRPSTASPATSSRAACSRPTHELACYRALAEAFPGDSLRYDPNAALPLEEAIRFGRAIEDLRNDYYEDPVWGLNGMRQVRAAVRIPTATNTVVVNFEQLAANLRDPAVDVILLDTTFWGGIRPCIKAAGRVRDLPGRDRRPLLGRARHPARDHAAPGCRAAQPHLRRRRPLPSPRRRRDRRRQARPTATAPSPCPTPRAWASASTATGSSAGPSTTAGSAAIPTTATRNGPAGSPWSRTRAGPTRSTMRCRRSTSAPAHHARTPAG